MTCMHVCHLDQKTESKLVNVCCNIMTGMSIRPEDRKQVSLFVLRFYSPVNPVGSCRVRSVYLITRLLGRLNPLSGSSVLCTFFRQKLTTALLELAEGRE